MHLGHVVLAVMLVITLWWLYRRLSKLPVAVAEAVVLTDVYEPSINRDGLTQIWRTVRQRENIWLTLNEQLRYNLEHLDPRYQQVGGVVEYGEPQRLPNGHYQAYVKVRFVRKSR